MHKELKNKKKNTQVVWNKGGIKLSWKHMS